MNCKEIQEKSVIEIFNGMDFYDNSTNYTLLNSGECLKVDEAIDSNEVENVSELYRILKYSREPKSFGNAIDAAVKALDSWKNSSFLKRANSLHKIWKALADTSKSASEFKNELLTLTSYFDFYSDLAIHLEEYKNWTSCGVILIILSDYSPFLVLGATVPPALAMGCAVIVLVPEKIKTVSLFLEETIVEAGSPEGLINTVTEFSEIHLSLCKEINKVFFCGPYLSAVKLHSRNVTRSFSFFCPDNTAAFILESGDIDAAVDKIVTETWTKTSLFAVSTVVIQESVYRHFLEKLKYRLQQFTIRNRSSKFKHNFTSEKINESANGDGFVEKFAVYENEISKTVTVNYQNQDINEDVTAFKVLTCRTAKEGIALLNNCRYSLGISIWTEIFSQALEISYMLACSNIWINSHGVFEAGEPLQLQGFSGNCVLGGSDGIFEYLSFSLDHKIEESKSNVDEMPDVEKLNALQAAFSTQHAFKTWQNIRNRRQYLKDVADCLRESDELSKLSDIISHFAHFGNLTTSSQRSSEGYFIIKRKTSVGVFLLFVNAASVDPVSIGSLITLIIAFGNAVIVILKERNLTVNLLIKNFNNILPKNICNVIVGIKNGIHLASDPHIQAIWIYDESTVSVEFLQRIQSHSAKSLKHVWVIPKNMPFSHHLFQKECLKNQVIWLTNVDQFP